MNLSLRRLAASSSFFFSLLLLGMTNASAQVPLEPSQLPARTSFYLVWRGAPKADVRKANTLFSLWDDPKFAPVRADLAQQLLEKEKSAGKTLSREEVESYFSLLENPFVIGYLSEPKSTAKSESTAAGKTSSWNGFFFVYDRTGKEALLNKAMLGMRSQSKEVPKLSQLTVSGIPTLKMESKSSTTYWVEDGKYAVSTSELSVLEDILARLAKKPAPTGSLAESVTFQEAGPLLGQGFLEFFFRIPKTEDANPDLTVKDIQLKPILDAIKLNSFHSLAGSITLEGAKTHMRGALLGDASPGTLFDLWGNNSTAPATLKFVPSDAVSFNSSHVNFSFLYQTIKNALRASAKPGQPSTSDLIEAIAQSKIGMSLPDAIALFSGDFASLQTSRSLDKNKQVYFLGIAKKPETLKLFHSVIGDRIISETDDGDVSYLKLSLNGEKGSAGDAFWNTYNLAITPDVILASKQKETLKTLLAQSKPSASGNELANLPRLSAARSQLPQKLNGLAFFDFEKLDWQGVKDKWLTDAKTEFDKKRASEIKTGAKPQGPATFQPPAWLVDADPQSFANHLHYSVSGSWKDAKGLHFEQWLE